MGITASGTVLTLRSRYAGTTDEAAAERMLDEVESRTRTALAPHVFGAGDDTLESVVVRGLKARGEMLAVAESCTGGMLGELITRVPGSSSAFLGGWITYANAMKQSELGVPGIVLERQGAVSKEAAHAMAVGGLERMAIGGGEKAIGMRHCLAITGIAGPGGGSEAKPVGLVFIAHAMGGGGADIAVDVRQFHFTGDRDDVRLRSARTALTMLYFQMAGLPTGSPRLLWEVRKPGPEV